MRGNSSCKHDKEIPRRFAGLQSELQHFTLKHTTQGLRVSAIYKPVSLGTVLCSHCHSDATYLLYMKLYYNTQKYELITPDQSTVSILTCNNNRQHSIILCRLVHHWKQHSLTKYEVNPHSSNTGRTYPSCAFRNSHVSKSCSLGSQTI